MTDQLESRFAEMVRCAAPTERDPLFRLQVLERRETERFRQRSSLTLAAACLVLVVAAAALALRPAGFGTLSAMILLVGCLAGHRLYGATLMARLRQLRR